MSIENRFYEIFRFQGRAASNSPCSSVCRKFSLKGWGYVCLRVICNQLALASNLFTRTLGNGDIWFSDGSKTDEDTG